MRKHLAILLLVIISAFSFCACNSGDVNNTIICDNCHEEIAASSQFCPKCGHEICDVLVCASCGAHLDVDDNFCKECGATVGEKQTEQGTNTSEATTEEPKPTESTSAEPETEEPHTDSPHTEEPHIHNYVVSIENDATCTENGRKKYTCTCGDSYTEDIPAIGHDYSGKTTLNATCTSESIKTFICSHCGDSYTESISKLAHQYVEKVSKTATCTEEGRKETSCSMCGEVKSSETISPLGHDCFCGKCDRCGINVAPPNISFPSIPHTQTYSYNYGKRTATINSLDFSYMKKLGSECWFYYTVKSSFSAPSTDKYDYSLQYRVYNSTGEVVHTARFNLGFDMSCNDNSRREEPIVIPGFSSNDTYRIEFYVHEKGFEW